MKENEKDYNPVISEEIRGIHVDEVNGILKKLGAICKILKGNKEENKEGNKKRNKKGNKEKNKNGSGFFCKINIKGKEMKVLFTNNHVLNEKNIKQNSIIEIQQNNNIYQIKISEDRFTSTNKELDYTCIQIFDNEPYNNYLIIDNEINNDNAYEKYKDDKFIIIQYIRNEDYPSVDDGEIKKINNNKEIYYNIYTLPGSSGSPIINLSRNLNVIGIHCGSVNKGHFKDLYNRGIYFQQILNDIQYNISNQDIKNEIICIYDIKTYNINKNINLLNYFESDEELFKKYNNKEDFQNSIDLFIDNQKIDFQFNYKFPKENKYNLTIKIKKLLQNLRNMFYNCSSLSSLNLSNFNTNNVQDMSNMFYYCSSLTSFHL